MTPTGSDALAEWSEVADQHTWSGLLIGNGVSRNVWEGFSYDSLFDVANSDDLEGGLTDDDRALFLALGIGTNFEAVLTALNTAKIVCGAVGVDSAPVEARYASVRAALVAAVHQVHLPWGSVDQAGLLAIRNALLKHDFVFSTNYDLLIYWAIMSASPDGFKDYFWGSAFDIADTEVWGSVTKVLYLHGGLHLYHDIASGTTFKERSGEYSNLLDRFGRRPDTIPLCITEGTSPEKLAAIGRSDYLWFAFEQFSAFTEPLVVLGQGLGETDAHLATVLSRIPDRAVAIGIYPGTSRRIVQEKAWYQRALPLADLFFFDSRTHPLGDPSLRVSI